MYQTVHKVTTASTVDQPLQPSQNLHDTKRRAVPLRQMTVFVIQGVCSVNANYNICQLMDTFHYN